jgi:hypothetical protein
MKIYCFNIDTTPYNARLNAFFNSKGLTQLHSISQCATHTTLVSMLTGKASTELLPETGVAYRTELKYQKDGHIDFPFKDEFIFNQLYNKGWEVKFYIPCMLARINSKDEGSFTAHVAHTGDYYKYERIPVYRRKEWTCPLCIETTMTPGKHYDTFVKEEKAAVNKIQQPSKKNQFYYAQYVHYSIVVKTKKNPNIAIDAVLELLENWNFDEPDSFFWIFNDHGNCKKFDYQCQRDAFGGWSVVKDNTSKPLEIKSKYVSLQDFYPTILKKVGMDYSKMKDGVQSIDEPFDKDRVYFVEDARLAVDKFKVTTFIACKYVGWDKRGREATALRSVTYFKPKKQYFSFEMNLKNRKARPAPMDESLKTQLNERYQKYL